MRLRTGRTGFLILAAAILVGVAVAEHRMGSYAAENLGKIAQPAPAALTEDSQYAVASYPVFEAALVEGAGRAETQIYCSTCHTPSYITMQPPLPRAIWDTEMQKMTKTYGAKIPPADAEKINRYLQEHYTPEMRK